MEISVIGLGYVGIIQAVNLCLLGYDVSCFDKDKEKLNAYADGKTMIFEAGLEDALKKSISNDRIRFITSEKEIYKNKDIIFVCVNTPDNDDGSCNLSYIDACIASLKKYINKDCILVIKSTVPIGTNDRLQKEFDKFKKYNVSVVSNPEFLSQGTAMDDFINTHRIVIGGEEKPVEIIKNLYKKLNKPFVLTSRIDAEIIKYASNSFLATKISFINEISRICELYSGDIENVTNGMMMDPRIGNRYLRAGLGFGGACLEKDVKSLITSAKNKNLEVPLLSSVIEVNNSQAFRLIDKCKSKYDLHNVRVSVLGLSFKENSDDIRNSIAIKNLHKLLELGAELTVYDPKAMAFVKRIFGNTIKYANNAIECLKNSEICFIFTRWKEFVDLSPQDFIENMTNPRIFDGVNIFSRIDFERYTIEYVAIGKKNESGTIKLDKKINDKHHKRC